MKKSKNIFWGLIFILLAVCVVLNHLELIPGGIPFIRIAIAALLAYVAVKGIMKLEFFEFFVPLALIITIFEDEIEELTSINIDKITPWTILLAAVLLSIGCSMIFRNSRKNICYKSLSGAFENSNGRTILENNFNGVTKYITGEIENVRIENNFGKSVVYFDNAIISKKVAEIFVENNFGATELYIPKNWRAEVRHSAAFGNVKVNGQPNNDMDAPLIILNAEANFGEISIYYI